MRFRSCVKSLICWGGIALAYIEERVTLRIAADQGEFMINRVVEVSEMGGCADYPLPAT
jgi:hypothetical protein